MDSFEVENFRSLKHLKLEKLARVNLLVGKNNSGKTSVLEAIWALRSIEYAHWLLAIEKEREIAQERADFRHLFYRFDGSKTIRLAVQYEPGIMDGSRPFLNADLKLIRVSSAESGTRRPVESVARRIATSVVNVSVTLSNTPIPQPVIVDLHRAEAGEMFLVPVSEKAELFLGSPLAAPHNSGTEFISTKINRDDLTRKIEQLKVNKQEESLVRVLQQIDPRIQRIELVSDGQIYLDLGELFVNLLPLNLMGEGFQHLLDVTGAIAHMAGGAVLIDEIDNGLHYSALRILWRGILQAAREYDVQVFATTHSVEALRHLTWVLDDEENAGYRDDVAAYTLIRAEDDKVRSYRHNYTQLDYALDHGVEIRN